MKLLKKHSSLARAIACSILLMLFSFFIHNDFPLKLLSFFSLLLAAFIIGRNIVSADDLKKYTGEFPRRGKLIIFTLIGISGGIGFGLMYRWHLDAPLIPQSFGLFAVSAALIGCMEELVFRGYLQEKVKGSGAAFSVVFSTLSHTGYKSLLFMSPVLVISTSIGFLAFWTIIAGLIFGWVRHFSKSILPSLIGHALFDIWVYAEFTKAPWWVW